MIMSSVSIIAYFLLLSSAFMFDCQGNVMSSLRLKEAMSMLSVYSWPSCQHLQQIGHKGCCEITGNDSLSVGLSISTSHQTCAYNSTSQLEQHALPVVHALCLVTETRPPVRLTCQLKNTNQKHTNLEEWNWVELTSDFERLFCHTLSGECLVVNQIRLLIQDNNLTDLIFSASSFHAYDGLEFIPHLARLDGKREQPCAWRAKTTDPSEWLMVDLKTHYSIFGILFQSCDYYPVTQLDLDFANETDAYDTCKNISLSYDSNRYAIHWLDSAIDAQYWRIHPLKAGIQPNMWRARVKLDFIW